MISSYKHYILSYWYYDWTTQYKIAYFVQRNGLRNNSLITGQLHCQRPSIRQGDPSKGDGGRRDVPRRRAHQDHAGFELRTLCLPYLADYLGSRNRRGQSILSVRPCPTTLSVNLFQQPFILESLVLLFFKDFT